jgi:hypothetical protein
LTTYLTLPNDPVRAVRHALHGSPSPAAGCAFIPPVAGERRQFKRAMAIRLSDRGLCVCGACGSAVRHGRPANGTIASRSHRVAVCLVTKNLAYAAIPRRPLMEVWDGAAFVLMVVFIGSWLFAGGAVREVLVASLVLSSKRHTPTLE